MCYKIKLNTESIENTKNLRIYQDPWYVSITAHKLIRNSLATAIQSLSLSIVWFFYSFNSYAVQCACQMLYVNFVKKSLTAIVCHIAWERICFSLCSCVIWTVVITLKTWTEEHFAISRFKNIFTFHTLYIIMCIQITLKPLSG